MRADMLELRLIWTSLEGSCTCCMSEKNPPRRGDEIWPLAQVYARACRGMSLHIYENKLTFATFHGYFYSCILMILIPYPTRVVA
jgi:hypothetical protein